MAARDRSTDRLGTADVAQILGVSVSTISSYASRGQMPAASPCPCCGHAPTWARADVEVWVAARPGRGVGGGRPRKDAGP